MADAAPAELLEVTIKELLQAGPLPMAILLERLNELGLLDYLRAEGVTEAALGEAVIGDVIVSNAIWPTPDRVLALAAQLTDGMVLTHRLTAEELEGDEVLITPDLVVLGWDSPDGLGLVSGGRLQRLPARVHVPGEDRSTLAGPDGWLDDFGEGDLIAFTRRGGSVSVARVDDLGDDDREVGLLRAAVGTRIPAGQGEEAVPLILDALTADPGAFRFPVRPLGELLVAGGLERRGFSFGRSGERWRSFGEEFRDDQRDRLGRRFGFDSCCMKAFDVARDAFDAFDVDGMAGLDVAEVAGALSHGAVAPAFAALVLDDRDGDEHRLARFADTIILAVHEKQAAPARLLSALEADRRGDASAAEAVLEEALRVDPGYGPAALVLADYAIDRGELRRAVTLLHHPDLSSGATLETLEEFRVEMDAPYRHAGRNDPCPCGSGRKFKVCCQRDPKVPRSARTRLLTYKLARFAGRDHRRSRLIGVASAACDPDDADLAASMIAMARNPLILDFVSFEGCLADEYLEERGDLLPADERDLLEQLIDEPRRLWEIIDVEPGESLTLRDSTTGDVVRVAERLGSQDRTAGQLLLARIARLDDMNQIIGIPVEVPLRLRASTIELVDSHPDADALAAWYGQAVASPRLVNRENEPLLLCHTEMATDTDLSALHAALDECFEPEDDLQWTDLWIAPDGERIVRGTVRYDDGRLLIDTNSIERRERLVDIILNVVPDADVVVDERIDPRRSLSARRSAEGDMAGADSEVSPELAALADEYVRRKEAEWIDESIPALGGLTPRQALDDPTRREDLIALLREMDDQAVPKGARGFDADRIRALLGLES